MYSIKGKQAARIEPVTFSELNMTENDIEEVLRNSFEFQARRNAASYATIDKIDDLVKKVIGEPYIGGLKSACTDSLIPIGKFDNLFEAESLQKYLKTKFLRYMVSLVKSSQNTTQIVYRFVPLQDFTPQSDIDWTQSIPEIDKQLYKKYGLDQKEIAFIEEKVKAMD